MKAPNLHSQLKSYMPPVFAAKELDRLTGNAIRWRTIQNYKANQYPGVKIPEDCFMQDGPKKVLIVRDPFLKWWFSRFK